MRYERPLTEGVLLRRYKRFLAEVTLDGGEIVLAHVPNSGTMRGCSKPGSRCRVMPAAGGGRRLAWTLEQVDDGSTAVGVNTMRANRLAEEALREGVLRVPGLAGVWRLQREVSLADGSRIDFRLTDEHGAYWLEVKNVTWVEGGVALFPDAVTARGRRHVRELAARLAAGDRAAVLFVVQRGDARAVRAAREVDPAFARAIDAARRAGLVQGAVEIAVGAEGLSPRRSLPVEP